MKTAKIPTYGLVVICGGTGCDGGDGCAAASEVVILEVSVTDQLHFTNIFDPYIQGAVVPPLRLFIWPLSLQIRSDISTFATPDSAFL
jgi:hypothetical protein